MPSLRIPGNDGTVEEDALQTAVQEHDDVRKPNVAANQVVTVFQTTTFARGGPLGGQHGLYFWKSARPVFLSALRYWKSARPVF